MEGLVGDGLVDEVLFCCGDSLKEDLRSEPRLGVFVDLVQLNDDEANDDAALFKTVEAFGVELKTKGTGGGGTGLK